MKLKTLVAAVAFAAAGMANAAITTGGSATGSSLIFEAWDTVSGTGYVQALGPNFQTALGLTSGGLNVNLDSVGFSTLLGADTSGAALNWHVFATLQNDSSFSGYGLLTTVSTLPGAAFRVDAGQLGSLLTSQGDIAGTGHIGDINAALGAATFGTIAGANAAYGGGLGSGGAYYGNFLGGNSAKVGFGSLDFYQYANDPNTSNLLESKIGGTSKFTLNSAGNLNFAAVSSVPLPAAAWLFGSGLLGLIGIGRRRKQEA